MVVSDSRETTFTDDDEVCQCHDISTTDSQAELLKCNCARYKSSRIQGVIKIYNRQNSK